MATAKRKQIWIVALILLVILVGGSLYAVREFNRQPVSIAAANPDFTLTDYMLIKEFETNAVTASQKYIDKIILVSGVVKEVNKNGQGVHISLGGKESLSSVRCAIDSAFGSTAFEMGKDLTIKGVVVGFNSDDLLGDDIILNRCIPVSSNH